MLCGSDWMPRHRYLPHLIRAQRHEFDLLNRSLQIGNRTQENKAETIRLVIIARFKFLDDANRLY